jgi:hypothetical protein
LCVDLIVLPVRADEPNIGDPIGIIDPHHKVILVAGDVQTCGISMLHERRQTMVATLQNFAMSLMGIFSAVATSAQPVAARLLQGAEIELLLTRANYIETPSGRAEIVG